MSEQYVAVTLAEQTTKEEAATKTINNAAFVPVPPTTSYPAAYSAAATYAKGAVVTEGTQVYRSQQAGNKAHEPKADTEFTYWAPIGVSFVPLQNPTFGATSYVRGQ